MTSISGINTLSNLILFDYKYLRLDFTIVDKQGSGQGVLIVPIRRPYNISGLAFSGKLIEEFSSPNAKKGL